MPARVAVETLDRAAEVEASDYTLLREIIQVSIDGTEADARETAADPCVELIRARVAVKPYQLFQDNGPLFRISRAHLRFLSQSVIVIVTNKTHNALSVNTFI
jgi:hypothetical protein